MPESKDKVLRSLKMLAEERNVPILCTTHLHSGLERRKDKRLKPADPEKTGYPTEAADQIIFLYRDRYYDAFGEGGVHW